MTNSGLDHFRSVATSYAQFRPHYPEALFRWVAAQSPNHQAVWDCGSGSGQATEGLAQHFATVEATKISAARHAQAPPLRNVHYRVAPAERSGLPDASMDAVVVAQALHWFSLNAFYDEVRRVLRPGGLVVAGAMGWWSWKSPH